MVLLISGSPKKKSNCNQLVEYIKDKLSKENIPSDILKLSEVKISPCLDCGGCRKQPTCKINDDYNQIIPLFEKAKIIVVASPVYFGNVTAQLKALFDRTVGLRRNGSPLEHKFGAGIAVGGSRNGGQEFTLMAIQNWLHIHGMFSFPDSKPYSHFGGILTAHSFDEAEKDSIGMETVNALINNILFINKNYSHA